MIRSLWGAITEKVEWAIMVKVWGALVFLILGWGLKWERPQITNGVPERAMILSITLKKELISFDQKFSIISVLKVEDSKKKHYRFGGFFGLRRRKYTKPQLMMRAKGNQAVQQEARQSLE